MNYVFDIKGGIGKHVALTSFIRWLNIKQPKSKITIISAYPEVFEHNPRIHRNLPMTQAYIFEDYIKGKDFRSGEVYQRIEFYRDKNKMHVCELWPKAYGFRGYDKEFKTELFLTEGEEMDGKVFSSQNAPMITFQNSGGLPPGVQPNRTKLDGNGRDMPIPLAMRIVNILSRKGFKVLQLRGPTEMPLQGTLQISLPFRNLMPLVKHAVAHIGIDSSFLHVAGCFEKPMLIFWGQTSNENFGYKYSKVINAYREVGRHCRPHVGMPDNAGLYQYEDKNKGLEFAYSEEEIEEYVNKFLEMIK